MNVHISLSCIRCHANAHVQDIRPWVRRVLNRPPRTVRTDDPEKAKRGRRLYLDSLEEAVGDDRRTYARAIAKCNRLTPEKNAALYGKYWADYTDIPVSLARAARDLGVSPEQFSRAIDRQIKAVGATDPVLSAFLDPEKLEQNEGVLKGFQESEPIPIDSWHEAIPLAMLAIHNLAPAVKIERK